MKKLFLLLILILPLTTFAQSDLPEIGKITDIQGKTKVYIVADGESRKAILKKLKGTQIGVVDKSGDAEFFLEYKTLARDHVTSMQLLMETGQIDVYFYHDKSKVIAWSESKVGGGFKGDTPGAITGNFLKAYKKVSK